jgi:hypothetical protein
MLSPFSPYSGTCGYSYAVSCMEYLHPFKCTSFWTGEQYKADTQTLFTPPVAEWKRVLMLIPLLSDPHPQIRVVPKTSTGRVSVGVRQNIPTT